MPDQDDNGAVIQLSSWWRRKMDRARTLAARPASVTVLGGSLAALGIAEVVARAAASHLGSESTLALVLLALGSTVPLALLGAASAAILACGACTFSLADFHLLSAASAAALLLALYRLGRRPQSTGQLQIVAIALAIPFLVLAVTGPNPSSTESATLTVVLAALAPMAAIGGIAAQARGEARENRAMHEMMAGTLIEHTARGERARIARELHDVVAHHISMVAVQAETARLSVPGLPEAGAKRLSAIGDTAREALGEMRRLLGVLREDAGSEVVDRQPQPGLQQMTELIDEARVLTSCPTRLIFRGTPIALDPNVELVAYRIVQEALTNSRRHAPGAAVDVELAYAAGTLRLRVRDDGPGPPSSARLEGLGLTGMQERAAAVGGSVRTGLATGGGYLVEAVLPANVEEPT
jgi:signal transduction histidine kinase